jgi:hypothetical protein
MAEDAKPRSVVLTFWHQVWPLAVLAIALMVNLAWVGLLGYALAKLL